MSEVGLKVHDLPRFNDLNLQSVNTRSKWKLVLTLASSTSKQEVEVRRE